MIQTRAKAVLIIAHSRKFLFTVCVEKTTGTIYYIPVGGGIEFGEHSSKAARREMLEETGQPVINLSLLQVSENTFVFNGIDEHEIVFIYKADFANDEAYHSILHGNNDNGDAIKFVWATIKEIKEQSISVYPFNLLEILDGLLIFPPANTI
jgi:ADP-ribose pyrophosphatase YjhB (NUDIX family)